MSAKKVGRPSADDLTTEAAKQVMDAKKITTTDDDVTKTMERANALLEQSTKTEILEAAMLNAKRAKHVAKKDYHEEIQDDAAPKRSSSSMIPGGLSPDDIRTMAETLPEPQREPFIRQALGMGQTGNPLMQAWFSRGVATPQAPATATGQAQPMSFNDTMQAMMGMMAMQMQMAQQQNQDWREKQKYEEEAHRRRVEELREARGEVKTQQGPDPQVETLKMQLDFFKDTLKEYQTTIKDLTAAQKTATSPDDSLRKEMMEMQKQALADKERSMEQKIAQMEARLRDNQQFSMNLKDVMQKANEMGANIHVGDTTDLQLQNEHSYKMEQLRLQEERELREADLQRQALEAKNLDSQKQIEMIKTIAVAVAPALMNKGKPLKESSNGVKSLAGAVQ